MGTRLVSGGVHPLHTAMLSWVGEIQVIWDHTNPEAVTEMTRRASAEVPHPAVPGHPRPHLRLAGELGTHLELWATRWNQLGTRSGSCPAQPVFSYPNVGRPELRAVESYQTWAQEGPRSARRFLSRRVKLQRQPGAELLRLRQEGGNDPALQR